MIRVGYQPNRRPFSFRSGDGELVGLDVELAHDLARSLEVALEFVPLDPARLTDHFEQDHVDVALSGIPATVGHALGVEMSAPYLELHAGIVVPDGQRDRYESAAAVRSLGRIRIAVGDETFAGPLRRMLPEAEIVEIESKQSFFESKEPLADALVMSAEEGTSWSLAYPRFAVVVPRDAAAGFPVVFALPRTERDVKRVVDVWIALRKRDGTIQALYDYWVLGKLAGEPDPRWSVIRDVLGWVD